MRLPSLNLWFCAAVFITAAWFGVGLQSEDEFQHVILIAEHLRGHVGAEAMPIDFQAQWRGMLLPVIATGVFETCAFLSITDPFTLTLLLRLITAAFALWVMHGLARSAKHTLRMEHHQALDTLNWFLWLVPILLIRFTGETWSALLFARGLALLLDDKPRSALAIGLWWGAAVIVRPAAAVLPVSAWLWSLLVKKDDRARLALIIGGGMIAIAILTVIDSICYGTPAIPLWNYFVAAITGQESARFTALPWFHHGLFVIKYATIPIGALLFASLGILLWLKPRHVLVWLIIPFLIAHAIIPTKELRFLFPLVVLMPWLLVAAWDALCERWPRTMQRDLWLRLLFPFAVVNLVALVVGIVTPAGNGRIKLAQEISKRYGAQAVHIDALGDWRMAVPAFYLSAGSSFVYVDRIVPSKENDRHVVIAKASSDLERVQSLERIATATPEWTHRFLRCYSLEDGYDPLVLYRLTTENIGH
ncbi:MAG: hypothetical protein IPJ85_17760 [Flavobacteriales bacterium]|nr:hypothetical protein [Flavobacteriales bacterium]